MANYFETVCQYEQMQETGKAKKVSEHLLFEAESFTDAEAKLYEHMNDIDIKGFFVKDIKRKPVERIFTNNSAEKWYDVKVRFISIDEKSGVEKKTSTDYFVQADSSEGASAEINDGLRDSLSDWEIHTIRESQISEVFITK